MRFAILGDIHANLEALQGVLADAQAHEATHFVSLGDVVGYNANLYSPDEQLVELRRIEYDIGTARDKIVAAGL